MACPAYNAPYPKGERVGIWYRSSNGLVEFEDINAPFMAEYVSVNLMGGNSDSPHWLNVWTRRNLVDAPVGVPFADLFRCHRTRLQRPESGRHWRRFWP